MKKRVWEWIFKNGKKSFPAIIILTVLSVAMSIVQVRFATASKDVIDVATKETDGVFLVVFGVLAGLLVLRLILQIVANYLEVHTNSRFEIALKRRIFKTLMGKDYLSVAKYHSGELLNRIDSDVAVVVNGIIATLPSTALLLTSVIAAFFVLFNIDKTLAVIILCIGPFVAIGARIYSAKFKELHKKSQEYNGKTKSFMLEILQNLLVVKSFGNERVVLDKSQDLQEKSYKLRIKRVTISLFVQVGLFMIFNAGYYFALGYGAYRLSVGALTYGDVMAILALVSQIQMPFKNISSLLPQAFAVSASIERILELEDLKGENETGKAVDVKIYNDLEEIVYENATFSYSDDSKVSGIDMKIKKGECVVIAGESGAGKSTAIKLLLGIMNTDSGRIYLKGGFGEMEIGKETRPLFAYVPQGNLILSGTIRENITFGNQEAKDEDIINACKIAQIWEYIETLDLGLDTVLGEKGLGLSEGQAQRISIARALLHNAPILLLDESTSALDSITEKALLSAIRDMTDKTCIIVSHKQAAFDISDKVIYIEKKTLGE
ncbi:MAG: ABC transporter ATP-binding protein [Clostridia bacterium]|nr:ABC transporter ATP-binding protein [Clostridia bacterium]